MGTSSPLQRLLDDFPAESRDEAWAEFVDAHSRLLLHVCRSVARDHDGTMDAYAFVLEELRADDYARLRGYVPDGCTQFTTWLVVIVRRLCLDHHRRRYGRPRGDEPKSREAQLARRRLANLVGADVDADELPARSGAPDGAVRQRELASALHRSLAELEPADRLLLALRFDDGRPVREVARLLGLPTVFHVYRRQAAALAALRRALGAHGIDDPEP